MINGITHVAAVIVRDKDSVKFVKNISQSKMKIISKIECKDTTHNLNSIIEESDFLLIDRGDLIKKSQLKKNPAYSKNNY